jgi:polar amino acid transport system substrate-binding protein
MMTRHIIVVLPVLLLVGIVAYACSLSVPPAEPTRKVLSQEQVDAILNQPTATPSVPPPPVAGHDWSRIKAAGKIVVGTSADYPPFAYYGENFQIDGFDAALIREVGKKLGVEVELRDFAFDGLPAALQVGQVDAAIAAISITPERQKTVDFTNVYYAGEDAILARAGSNISLGGLRDIGQYRVGVQRDSAYGTWVKTTLIGAGLMQSDNLFEYAQADDAIRDLKEQRLDLVMMDSMPAQSFADQGDVVMVARGLNQQLFGIMIRKGAFPLQAKLNEALTQLQNEGKIAQLAEQYLKIKAAQLIVPPTITPQPAAAVATTIPVALPASSIPCDVMAYVADLTYDDQRMTAPPVLNRGQPFTKGWRVRNTGSCTWDSSYSLLYSGGNKPGAAMNGQADAIQGPVPPGATTDVYANLIAPSQYGIYLGFWEMRNPHGQTFGQRLWVGINVPAPIAPTPVPPPPPSDSINFRADRTNIRRGECTMIRWDVEGIKTVYFHQQGESWEDHGVVGHNAREVCPGNTVVYELRVIKRDDSVDIRQIQIIVEEGNVAAPEIWRFDTDPDSQVNAGRCVEIRWEVGGQVDQITIYANGDAIWDVAPARGRTDHCPGGSGVTYRIKARGPDSSSSDEHYVQIIQ